MTADVVFALRPKSLDGRGTGSFYPQRLAAQLPHHSAVDSGADILAH